MRTGAHFAGKCSRSCWFWSASIQNPRDQGRRRESVEESAKKSGSIVLMLAGATPERDAKKRATSFSLVDVTQKSS